MSTKTNFKRIALVAVAALGMGVLSSVPSNAVINSAPTVTVSAGTATKAKADSTTAGSVTVKYLPTAAADTVSIAVDPKSFPTTTVPRLNMYFGDTATTVGAQGMPNSITTAGESVSVTSSAQIANEANIVIIPASANSSWIGLKMLAQLDTTQARTAGSYVFTITVTPFDGGMRGTPVQADLTITVAVLDSEATTASAGTSVAYVNTTATTTTTDSTPSVLSTASTTPRAFIYVDLKNASGAAASESITITTTVGTIGTSGTSGSVGKQVTLAYTGGANYYGIFADGTAGTAVITVKSTSVTFANKTVVFYSAAPTTITLTPLNTTPGVGTSTVFTAVAKDANGATWGGALAVYSDTLATISDTGTACTSLVATKGYHVCTVTGVVAGTAKVTVRDSSLAIVSSALSLTISAATAATVKLSWDKASYAPGEKAYLFVDVLGSDGKSVPSNTYANLFATGGISLSSSAGNGSDTLTSTVIYTNNTMASLAIGTGTDPRAVYTVYMPSTGGTIKATATGGTSLPLAGQVAVSASATVTDSGAAALAAVTALATTVASLKTLITTLTNLVLKIQKKVKA